MMNIRSTLGGTAASWLVRSTPDRAVAVLALVYKFLSIGKVNAGGNPSMDEYPTREGGRRNTPSRFKLKRLKIRAGHFTYLPYISSWSVQQSCYSSLFTYWSAIVTSQRGGGSLELHSYHGSGNVLHPCNIHEPNTCTILISSLFRESARWPSVRQGTALIGWLPDSCHSVDNTRQVCEADADRHRS